MDKPVLDSSTFRKISHSQGVSRSTNQPKSKWDISGYTASLLHPESPRSDVSTTAGSPAHKVVKTKPKPARKYIENVKPNVTTDKPSPASPAHSLQRMSITTAKPLTPEERERRYFRMVEAFSLYGLRGLEPLDALRHAIVNRTDSLNRAYLLLDTDKSGAISYQEFFRGLRQMGIDTEDLLGMSTFSAFKKMDLNEGGSISLVELLGAFPDNDDLYSRHPNWFVPGSMMWSRYLQNRRTDKSTLNRPPSWDKFVLMRRHGAGLNDKKQAEFNRIRGELARQLQSSDPTIKNLCIQYLQRTLNLSNEPDSTRVTAEAADEQERFNHIAVKIADEIRDLTRFKTDLQTCRSKMADLIGTSATAAVKNINKPKSDETAPIDPLESTDPDREALIKRVFNSLLGSDDYWRAKKEWGEVLVHEFAKQMNDRGMNKDEEKMLKALFIANAERRDVLEAKLSKDAKRVCRLTHLHAHSQNPKIEELALEKPAFVFVIKNLLPNKKIPGEQITYWWSEIAKDPRLCSFDELLDWYARFIM